MSVFFNMLCSENSGDDFAESILFDAPEIIAGGQSNTFVQGTNVYSSTIDPITNLVYNFCYDQGYTSNLPIVCLGHGYGGNADTITFAQMQNYAKYGFFVICIGMRGRNNASGLQDSGGREIYDLYDAIQHVQSNYNLVSTKKVAWSGFSGGGGNGLSLFCRFPDLCNVVVSHYGMSDYGESISTSWWVTNPSYQHTIQSWIGATPGQNIKLYKSRNARRAIATNLKAGKLRLYHNNNDTAVNVVHSKEIETLINNTNKSNLMIAMFSDTLYTHDNYNASTILDFKDEIKNINTFTLKSGGLKIIGWVKVRYFEIWLGDGLSNVGHVMFNIEKKIFKVSVLEATSPVTIMIKFNNITKTYTGFETTFYF